MIGRGKLQFLATSGAALAVERGFRCFFPAARARANGEFLFAAVPWRTCLGGVSMQATSVSNWAAAGLAAALAAGAVLVVMRMGGRLPRAHPNARSMHDRPVPRVGGLAIWAGFLPVALFFPSPAPQRAAWLVAWAGVAVVSMIDDWRGVRAWTRLAVHAIAAAIAGGAVLNAGSAPWTGGGALIWAAAACLIVWCANLYNFMDGSDGLATAMTVFGFGAYGVAAARADVPGEAYFALAAAALPLLAVNAPPARVFIGDVGAVPAGLPGRRLRRVGMRGRRVAGLVSAARVPAFRRGRDAHAVAATRARRAAVRGPSGALLPTVEPARRGPSRNVPRLRSADGGNDLRRARRASGSYRRMAGACSVAWTVVVAAFFAGIDYHWKRRSDSAR